METSVRALFGRYAAAFERALAGEEDLDEIADFYASDFIAASPAGVMTGKNDAQLKTVMAQGFARYRALGTRAMQLRGLRLTPLDALHGVAHVAWRAIYARKAGPDVVIDFEVQYFVQLRDGTPRVFGWVTGDEEAALKEHGVL